MNQQELVEQGRQIIAWFEDVNRCFGTDFEPDKQGRKEITDYISLLLSCDLFETEWLKKDKYNEAGVSLKQGMEDYQQLIDAEKALIQLALPQAVPSDPIGMASDLKDTAHAMQDTFLNYLNGYKHAIASGLAPEELESEQMRKSILDGLTEELEIIDYTLDFLRQTRELTGIDFEANEKGLLAIQKLIHRLNHQYTILPQWLRENRFQNLTGLYKRMRQLAETIMDTEAELCQYWSPEIYTIDAHGLLERFRKDYSSMIRRLSRQYHMDREYICSMAYQQDVDLLDGDIQVLLERVQNYQISKREFERYDSEAFRLFGSYYLGLATNWDTLEAALMEARQCRSFITEYGGTEALLYLMALPWPERRLYSLKEMTLEFLEQNRIAASLINVTSPYKGKNLNRCRRILLSQKNELETYMSSVDQMAVIMTENLYRFAGERGKFTESPSASYIQEYIRLYGLACDRVNAFSKAEVKLTECFPTLYQGMASDWDKISYSWKHGKRICDYANTHVIARETTELLRLPLEERQNIKIQGKTLMDMGFGNGRRDYVEFFNQYPDNVRDMLKKC